MVSPTIGVVELGLHSLAVASVLSSQVCNSLSTTPLSNGAAEMGRSFSRPFSCLMERGTPINSSVSTSQLWYTWRVKEKVAKQLNKNKVLLAEVVVDILVVGEGRALDAMNLALVVRLSWGGGDKKLWDLFSVIDKREPVVEAFASKVKGMREIKNLDCSISPVKGQSRQGFLGSKNAFSALPSRYNLHQLFLSEYAAHPQ